MTASDPNPVYLKKKELARRLSVSPRTIEEWAQRRMIPHLAVSPRLNLYNYDEVLAVLEKRYKVEPVLR